MWFADSHSSWTHFLKKWLGLSLLLHAVAAVTSPGFFHADEHFQILEFLNWKLGLTPASALPIEFAEKMRPWLQPGILYFFTKGWLALGIDDPFFWALSYRAVSALLGWLSLVALALCSVHFFQEERWRRTAVLSLCGLWYLPAFHARPSSESWSASAFVLGLCVFLLSCVYRKRGRPFAWSLLSGFLFGLSFEFRYQVAVMVVGALLWFWIRARIGWRESLGLIVGGVAALALGTGADAWGYGQWVLAPWNYIDFNLIRGMVAVVDTDPWWDLFRRAITESWPLLGILLLLSIVIAWITHPLHVLTWSHAPLFLTHAIIGHKELRFLFPLLTAAPVLLVLTIQWIRRRSAGLLLPRWVLKFFLIWNGIGLLGLTLMPAWMPIRFHDFFWHFQERHPEPIVLHWKNRNPFEVNGIAMHFYRARRTILEPIEDYRQVPRALRPGEVYWMFYDGFTLSGDAEGLKAYCRPEFKALPHWIEALAESLGVSRYLRNVTNWSLYRCEGPFH